MRTSKDVCWQDGEKHYQPESMLTGAHESDVTIIGGGVTGMASAYFIKKRFPEKKVIILEGEYIGYGSSGRNAGFCGGTMGNNIHSLQTIRQMLGAENARVMQSLSHKGFSILEGLIKEHGIDCDHEKTGFLTLAENDKQNRVLEKLDSAFKETGADTRLMDKKETKDRFAAPGIQNGLYFADNLLLNPAKFVRGMKKVVTSLGVEVYEHSPCLNIEQGQVHAIYTAGGIVHSKNLVMATNAYPNPMGLKHYKVLPAYVHYIATEPLRKEQLDEFGWTGREGVIGVKNFFWLIRLTKENRFVYSSSNARYFKNIYRDYSHFPKEYKLMYQQMTKRFPVLKDIGISHSWGGRIGLTALCIPLIGRTGKYNNIYYGMGYNGHGMPWSQVVGNIISELMANEKSYLTENAAINKFALGVPSATLSYLAIRILTYYYKLLDRRLDF